MQDLVILGAGGHGKVTADLARACGFHPRAFVDVARVGELAEPGGTTIDMDQAAFMAAVLRGETPFGTNATIAIGDNTARLNLFFELRRHMNLPTLVHPTAWVSPSAQIGLGTHICPMVVIHPAAWVGHATILNTRCIVEHDCIVGDGVHISPGAVLCGGVEVGDGAWIGAGAVVIPGIRIGENAIIGAGAVVIRDVPAGAKMVGNPARHIMTP
jgi:sugar O-acyltransferase (sialic acid O-acetyltransferase NeuD family)